jgi:hypothetical protein
VETYRSRLMEKPDPHDVPGLVKFANQHGLIPQDEIQPPSSPFPRPPSRTNVKLSRQPFRPFFAKE